MKLKRLQKVMCLMILFCFMFVSCVRPQMSMLDAYTAPHPDGFGNVITLIIGSIPPEQFIAGGYNGMFATPSYIFKDDGSVLNLRTISMDSIKNAVDGGNAWVTIVNSPVDEIEGDLFNIIDRCGTRMYNLAGKFQPLETTFGKIDIKHHKDFLFKIKKSSPNVIELRRDTEDWDIFMGHLRQFGKNKVNWLRGYMAKEHGSPLTLEALEEIAKKDSIVKNFWEWLFEDLKLIIGGKISWEETVGHLVFAKVVSLPKLFKHDNREGCPGYMPNAEEVSYMILRGRSYGNSFGGSAEVVYEYSDDTPLPIDAQMKYYEQTGEMFQTYGDYKKYVDDRNEREGSKIDEYNRKIDEYNKN